MLKVHKAHMVVTGCDDYMGLFRSPVYKRFMSKLHQFLCERRVYEVL